MEPRVGILGGGQLGRMLALAGYALGVRTRFWDPAADAPVCALADCVTAPFTDGSALERFCEGLSAATFEFENVPADLLAQVASRVRTAPSPDALSAAHDRLHEKELFARLRLPHARFAAVSSLDELKRATAELGFPSVLKTRRLGYDGKGQRVLRGPDDIAEAWSSLGELPLILEEFVGFEREISILAAVGSDGSTQLYPLVQNLHIDGILRASLPLEQGSALGVQADQIARQIAGELKYTGVLAVETFERGGLLIANEIAPRVHNSGHWTIEGAVTSQFENHLRAVMGWPLGSTALREPCVMANLIGSLPSPEDVLSVEGAHLHRYGKEPRPGRKVGHITITAANRLSLANRVARLADKLPVEAGFMRRVLGSEEGIS